jgi:hypothetical protein
LVLSEEQKQLVKAAIEGATTKAQIDFIEAELKAGRFDSLLTISASAEASVTEGSSSSSSGSGSGAIEA